MQLRQHLSGSLDAIAVTLARVAAAVATWMLSVLLARTLGSGGFGIFVGLTAVLQVVSVVPDAGLNCVLMRDVAVKPELASAYARAVRRLRLWLSTSVACLVCAVALLRPDLGGAALAIGATGLVPLTQARTSEGLLYALGRIHRAAQLSAMYAAARLVLGAAPALLGFGVSGVMAGQTAAAVLYAATMSAAVRLDRSVKGAALSFRALLQASYPYAVLVALETLYSRLDVFLLAALTGSTPVVGIYGAAYKMFEAANIPASSFGAVLIPSYSRRLAQKDVTLARSLIIAVAIAMAAGSAISMLVVPNASFIMTVVFGEAYAPAGGALAALALATIPGFAVYPLAALLAASHRQNALVVRSAAQIALNGTANLLLIPALGVTGSGIAMLITATAGLLLYGDLARRVVLEGGHAAT